MAFGNVLLGVGKVFAADGELPLHSRMRRPLHKQSGVKKSPFEKGLITAELAESMVKYTPMQGLSSRKCSVFRSLLEIF